MTYAHIQIHYRIDSRVIRPGSGLFQPSRRQNNPRSRTVGGIERHENNSVLVFKKEPV